MKNKMKIVGNIYTYGVYGVQTTEGEMIYVGSGEINCCLGRHLHFLKRGLYATTNKAEMQRLYDMDCLEFHVIHESEQKNVYKTFTIEQRNQLDKAMSVLEQFYIEMYRDTICNSHNTVKRHSSNHDANTTEKRRLVNTGELNPMNKYSEELISNILWLKESGYMPIDIMKLINKQVDITMSKEYIKIIGVQKWIYAEAKKPSWIDEDGNIIEKL
ncbi:hypothetical protein K2F43_00865 [Clostridium estertheticum]|uniref:hypothetical protein n=1 Tax=Clostridium estertheticum TaxID=238834 RepID=UPI001C6E8BD5|nr:hypothetical protein [Clostridium estertheticum]MBW9169752.1 hypothetical protein [Clostridium estertheticum]WLC74742.1 hypothetical protein KTC99_18600 [Clostridium estertheticum]